ncbi:MAG: hypothetical protein M2R45_04211 [Verrucomicrobia subdivision 3 bacterium]|nr:hypothetical protein [Limisphaerales bacterium]MCS1417052.1 hypothetical protein [Limisphaerales bacterium]
MCFRSFYDYLAAGNFTMPSPSPPSPIAIMNIQLCEAILTRQSHTRKHLLNIRFTLTNADLNQLRQGESSVSIINSGSASPNNSP